MPYKRVFYKKGTPDEKVVRFETNNDSKVMSVEDNGNIVRKTQEKAELNKLAEGDSIDVDLSGMNIEIVAEGTTIVTRSNPICFWYYSCGHWHVYCC